MALEARTPPRTPLGPAGRPVVNCCCVSCVYMYVHMYTRIYLSCNIIRSDKNNTKQDDNKMQHRFISRQMNTATFKIPRGSPAPARSAWDPPPAGDPCAHSVICLSPFIPTSGKPLVSLFVCVFGWGEEPGGNFLVCTSGHRAATRHKCFHSFCGSP